MNSGIFLHFEFLIYTVDNQYFSSKRPQQSCISLLLQFHPVAKIPFKQFLYLQFLGILSSRISLDIESFDP